MDYTKFTEEYKKVLTESTDDSELRNYVRSVVEDILSEKKPKYYDIISGSPKQNQQASQNKLRDKFEMASVDLDRTIKSMEDFVTTFNDLYIEDVTFKNDMRENIKRELRRTIESFTEFEKFLDENNF